MGVSTLGLRMLSFRLGASGGMVVIWDAMVASKIDSDLGSFSVSALLDFKGRYQWRVNSVCGPVQPQLRTLF